MVQRYRHSAPRWTPADAPRMAGLVRVVAVAMMPVMVSMVVPVVLLGLVLAGGLPTFRYCSAQQEWASNNKENYRTIGRWAHGFIQVVIINSGTTPPNGLRVSGGRSVQDVSLSGPFMARTKCSPGHGRSGLDEIPLLQLRQVWEVPTRQVGSGHPIWASVGAGTTSFPYPSLERPFSRENPAELTSGGPWTTPTCVIL